MARDAQWWVPRIRSPAIPRPIPTALHNGHVALVDQAQHGVMIDDPVADYADDLAFILQPATHRDHRGRHDLQQAPFDPNLWRSTAKLGLDSQEVVSDEARIPMSRDGHFWAEVGLNGTKQRMLVDSGATVTALSGRPLRPRA